MYRWVVGVVVGCLVGTAHAHAAPPIRDGEFVVAEGADFSVGGRPFHVVGANVGVVHGGAHRRAMPETLEAAASDGLNVVRIWALGERASDAPSWTREYSFRLGRGGWVEESFEHLDRVLDEARRLGLRVILVLANRWGDHGGVPPAVSEDEDHP